MGSLNVVVYFYYRTSTFVIISASVFEDHLFGVWFCHQHFQQRWTSAISHQQWAPPFICTTLGRRTFKSRHLIFVQLRFCFDDHWLEAKSARGLYLNIQLLWVHLCIGRRRLLQNLCSALR